MKGRFVVLAWFVLTAILPVFPTKTASATSPTEAKVIISEIKLGGDSYSQGADQPKDPQEYVTFYNAGDNSVTLDGWVLEYAKPTFDKNYCDSTSWASHNINGSASTTKLSGTLEAGQISPPIVRALTDNASGSLHLVDASDANNLVVSDLVGWGTSAPCWETTPTSIPTSGKSLKRYLDCDTDYPINTDNNSSDFAINQPPAPNSLSYPYISSCQDDTTPPTEPQPTCEGIIISEILPNPSGTDTGHEFIELYNPTTAAIPLDNCSLQTTADQKTYTFAGVTLASGQFAAFYDSQTGLTLPNAAGGTVWLLSPTNELQAITYPADMDDDTAWALFTDAWQITYQPTPNANNVLVDSKPCPAGQVRSPDTGRCRSSLVLTTTSMGSCPAGQERNPATNRCRSTTTAGGSSSLAPCKPGQERNPATNRCRSVLATSTSLKACPAGQARNPTTNRCRKIVTGSIGSVQDVKSAAVTASGAKWIIVSGSLLAALAFAVYEWRQEIMLKFLDLKGRLAGLKAGH